MPLSAIPVENITIDKKDVLINIDTTKILTATILPEDADDKIVIWESEDPEIATIEPEEEGSNIATINPVDIGNVKIFARSNYDPENIYDVCNITVVDAETVTDITLDKEELTIEKENTEQLIATLVPESAPHDLITWESSDTDVVEVDENGNVTAIGPGECIITATVESVEELSASCQIKVIVYPESISLNYSEINHIINETEMETLNASLTPEDCTETSIEWSSSDENVVIYNGYINYVNNGRCVVTAKDVKGHTASCTFNVYIRAQKPQPPVAETIEERSITLVASPNMAYSIDSGETWQDSNIFNNLEPNKKYYFCQKIKDHDYIKESTKSDFVEIKTKDIVHVESVELNVHEISINLDNESGLFQFETTVLPENAEIKDVYYSLDNTSIGFVDSDGTFRAINYGECTVTVTSIDGRKSDTCDITISKKWETPAAPIVTDLTINSMTVITDNLTVFSLDGGNVWKPGPVITGLMPKTQYNIVCKTLADGLRNESDISAKTFLITPIQNPIETDPNPTGITLSAHNLEFDLNGNTYATLLYTVVPLDTTKNNVIWYTDNSSVVSINSGGEINAIGTGKATIYVRTIIDGRVDKCVCTVYKINPRPQPPIAKEVDVHSIELEHYPGCEYSMDGVHWTSNTLFDGLNKNTYYTLYQRYKAINEYEPASESSYGLTVKTLTDETPGGESESGYTWGQEVECNDIPVYCSPFATKSSFKISGKYYIFNLIERKHRIRLTKIHDYVGVYGHAVGWVNIADLKLIENVIYVGDKVVVNGDINIYADGSGISIHEDEQVMYITDIIEGQEYCYGVTSKPGLNRQGFAREDQVVKYKTIVI